MKLVECVPNFSEGRDQETVAAITRAVEHVPGVRVLDVSSDPWHHRSVLTMAGPAQAVAEGAFAAVREARDRIDLRRHQGQHPRMGAMDVVPFVPLGDSTMADCIDLARALGERVGRELEIPVFLYERAATRPARRDLVAVRRGGFEGLSRLIGGDSAHDPDFGPAHIHPTAGAVAIGARPLLVALNIFLGDAANLRAVGEIARAVRASSGGLPGVKALAFVVNGQAQLSMNLTDLEVTPAHIAYAAVLHEARRHGLHATGTELIGLAPERLFLLAGADRLGLAPEAMTRVLEHRLRDAGLMEPERSGQNGTDALP